jgi:hypothetical protein
MLSKNSKSSSLLLKFKIEYLKKIWNKLFNNYVSGIWSINSVIFGDKKTVVGLVWTKGDYLS